MKLATVIVGTDAERFGRVGANPERLALANQIARFVENEGADLCVMPAGYLRPRPRASSDPRWHGLARLNDSPVQSIHPGMAHSFPGYRVVQPLYTSARSIVERAVCAGDGQTVVIKQSAGECGGRRRPQRIQSTRWGGGIHHRVSLHGRLT